VLVTGLEPYTTYYYRFIVETPDGVRRSRTGRTKTAPPQDADVPVRFAVLSCQDYSAHYHVLRQVVDVAPDFFVHLGDYIYETADDPSFQADGVRSIHFRDEVGAAKLSVVTTDGAPPRTLLAARSLDNYRQLYQTYRSDRWLQRLHETTPMIAVWDDHEFANDGTGQRTPESPKADPQRRQNADRAWVEYMPVDYPTEPALGSAPFPDDLRIYRDFHFGRHLHLVMTDSRRYRPPHLISEDTFPGAVLADEMSLIAAMGELPAIAKPYVDLDAPEHNNLTQTLRRAAADWGLTPTAFSGNQDLAYLNTWLERYNTEHPSAELPLLTADQAAGRGIAALHVGKSSPNSTFGSRYLVIQEAFELVAKARYEATAGASEQLLGNEQRAWFLDTLKRSTATWKVWGNEYTFLQKIADLSALPLPSPELRHRFLLSVEDWDGAPNERLALLEELASVDNLAIVTGDIHSFFVGTPGVNIGTSTPSLVEFVCGAVSSATYERLLETLVTIEGFQDIAPLASAVLTLSNPHVTFNNLSSNGFALLEVNERALRTTYHMIASSELQAAELTVPVSKLVTTQTFVLDKRGKLTLAD
jgi:alkaline phosphatase D